MERIRLKLMTKDTQMNALNEVVETLRRDTSGLQIELTDAAEQLRRKRTTPNQGQHVVLCRARGRRPPGGDQGQEAQSRI
mmetsp:Transcript_26690/g.63483  ORF Transcript_26690/g.63483 Transcript_26690/m.63483 type:complete len:80 (+) Transcript_26690:212-451(+)